jgi:beta-fructofuranosidase
VDEIARADRLVESYQELKEKFEADPNRPRYHFLPPAGWLNDPNGAIFWKGRYHLFYQYYPYGAKHLRELDGGIKHYPLCWGHTSSRDLVHWVHHPVALRPSPGGPDEGLCASGHAVDNDGVATIIYLGIPGGICIATSEDDDLVGWTKHTDAVIPVSKPGEPVHGKYSLGDPTMWKEGAWWYALCGGKDPEGGDACSLFKSKDTLNWTFVHAFYKSDRRWTSVEDDCACPDYSPLGNRHLLLFHSHQTGVQYYLGDQKGESFYPEIHGYMNWAGGQLNAPITMLDGKGRRLFWGWVCEARPMIVQRQAAWAGAFSLPRVLDLASDGGLTIEPTPELTVLRYNLRTWSAVRLEADGEFSLDSVRGDALELALGLDVRAAGEVGLSQSESPPTVSSRQ